MDPVLLGFSFALGLAMGSFVNVVVYRYNTGVPITGRSFCLSCGSPLRWYEMLPVLSYVFLRGRCAHCGSKFSPQYPLVELLTGTLFAAALLHASRVLEGVEFALGAAFLFVVMTLLVAITVYDLKHTIIPDLFSGLFALTALAVSFLFPALAHGDAPRLEALGSSMFAGLVLAAPFAAIFFFSSGRLMGFGDAKLAAGIGFLLGFGKGLAALMLSFWMGGAVALVLLFLREGAFTMKSEIPFGPFLVAGTLVSLFYPVADTIFHAFTF